jgi:two-component system, chemotaxis family, sensor kinase Cph1
MGTRADATEEAFRANAFGGEDEEFLAFATDGAERIRKIIDALREYSRVETQGYPLESIEPEGVLEAVLTDLQL